MKALATMIHEPGGARARRLVPAAEERMRAEVRASFATEAEASAFFLRGLARRWHDCEACPLHESRSRVVFGEGYPDPDLLVVGEAPWKREDATGRPLVGPAGALFRRVARAVGLDLRRSSFLTNVVGCRPRRLRAPDETERLACLPRLVATAEILRPRILLLLGATAARWAGIEGVGGARGIVPPSRWPDLGTARVGLRGVVLTWHPSRVLRAEGRGERRIAFREFASDVRLVRRILDALAAEDATRGA